MKRLSAKYRAQLSDKLMDWANLIFVGTVIVQFTPQVNINWMVTILGMTLLLGSYYVAYLLMEGGGR